VKVLPARMITHSTTKPESMDKVQARSRRSRTVIEKGIKGDEESKENEGMIKKVISISANVIGVSTYYLMRISTSQ
jgi:hypothetical protein